MRIVRRLWILRRGAGFPVCSGARSRWRPAVSSPMGPSSTRYTDEFQYTSTKSSKARSPLNCLRNYPRSLSCSLISARRSKSASQFRLICWRERTKSSSNRSAPFKSSKCSKAPGVQYEIGQSVINGSQTHGARLMSQATLIRLLAIFVLASASWAEAQQDKTIRIGFLGGMAAPAFGARIDVFRQQLRELGYSEGKNIAFEERWADGKADRLDPLAAELVARKVDVLVTFGGSAPAHAAKKATATIPIVMAAGGSDPAAAGLVASLARPGGNITGM